MPPLPRHQTLYPRFFKRLLDIAGALVLLSLLAPFLLLLALIIAVNSRGCPIFTQWRIGRGCVPFRIIKFKTMNDRTGADGQLLPDSERTTSFGSLLRCTSLDRTAGTRQRPCRRHELHRPPPLDSRNKWTPSPPPPDASG